MRFLINALLALLALIIGGCLIIGVYSIVVEYVNITAIKENVRKWLRNRENVEALKDIGYTVNDNGQVFKNALAQEVKVSITNIGNNQVSMALFIDEQKIKKMEVTGKKGVASDIKEQMTILI
ncbi:MAG: hypothetical protein AB2421_13950 [Thermotaleaceae bacterium]